MKNALMAKSGIALVLAGLVPVLETAAQSSDDETARTLGTMTVTAQKRK
ncbi:MAG: hypothetical protein AAF950_17835 [Pseudomonadota bacterium]